MSCSHEIIDPTARTFGDPEPSVALTVAVNVEAVNMIYEKLMRCALSYGGYCTGTKVAPPPPAVPLRCPALPCPAPPCSPHSPLVCLQVEHCPFGPTLTTYARSDEGAFLRRPLPLGFLRLPADDERAHA